MHRDTLSRPPVTKLLFLLAFSAFASPSPAKTAWIGASSPKASSTAFDTSTAIKRPYDVLDYNLRMDWRYAFAGKTAIYNGVNVISLSLTDTTSSIDLDAAEMSIDSIAINGVFVTPVPQPIQEVVHVPLPPNFQSKGATFVMRVAYTHTKVDNPVPPQGGFFFFSKGTFSGFGPWYYTNGAWNHDSLMVEEDLAYTMSEPVDAHRWMPCNDRSYDKANYEANIVVPDGYTAQSNGTLMSVDSTNFDRSRTFHWVSDRPLSTYLMCANASKWVTWGDYYHRVTNPNDSVPVIYFAWAKDYDGTGGDRLDAKYSFRNTPKMLEADSRAFGEYPFKEYGQIPLEPFYFGGMEHQTMTSLERIILDSSRGGEDVIAHELFHQWFGDKTTCETFDDIWLNESFATFGEAFWEESIRGKDTYNNYMLGIARMFFGAAQGVVHAPIYAPPINDWYGSYAPLVYDKGGCVLHMLRRALNNDTLFYNTLHDYSNAYAYTTANTFQFRNFLQERAGAQSPIDLYEFINQWILGPGWPIYNISWAQSKDNLVRVRVTQSQDSTDHFTMPLRFKAVAGTDTVNLTFINNKRSQFFTAQLDRSIDNLIFDSVAVVASQFTLTQDPSLSVANAPNASDDLRVYMTDGIAKLTFSPIVSERGTVSIVDVLGRTVVQREVGAGSRSLDISEGTLGSGDYFAELTDGARRASARFHVEK